MKKFTALQAGLDCIPDTRSTNCLQMKDSVAAALILDKYFDNPSTAAYVKPGQWRGGWQGGAVRPSQSPPSKP